MGLRTVPGEAGTLIEALTDSARDEPWARGEEDEDDNDEEDDEDDDDDWDWDDGLGRLTRAHGCSVRNTPQVCCLAQVAFCLVSSGPN